MSDENSSLLRRAGRVLAEIVVALYVIADSVVSLLCSPVMRFLSGLQIVQRLERAISALPAYVILMLMVGPFIVAEFAKIFALFWMSEGHLRSGMTILISAYVVSIFGCERILHAGKPKLMTIPWFAACYNWVMALRDQVFAWFRRTTVWRTAMEVRDRGQALMQRSLDRLRAFAGRKPRNALERR